MAKVLLRMFGVQSHIDSAPLDGVRGKRLPESGGDTNEDFNPKEHRGTGFRVHCPRSLSSRGLYLVPWSQIHSRRHRKREVGALHMPDVTFGVFMSALESAHPGDLVLEGVELLRCLAGM